MCSARVSREGVRNPARPQDGLGASILHADLDAFYASVEQRDDPSLRGRPMFVGGGVVLAASYEARARGVRTAMSEGRARQLCPDAIVVPPRMDAYTEASRRVFEIFNETTPLVEPLSIDEAFLDVGGLRRIAGEPLEIAERLRERVRDEVGLGLSVGIAGTKFLAKVASGEAKPDGVRLVEPGAELTFLHPLEVGRVWGVGPATSDKLAAFGITTVGELAALPEDVLVGIVGKASGHHLHSLANNRDPRKVVTARRRRSMGSQRALGRTKRTSAEIDDVLLELVDRVSSRLRAADRIGHTVVVRFRFDDYQRATRSRRLPQATASTTSILRAARMLLDDMADTVSDRGLTLLGLTITDLNSADAVQLALPFEAVEHVELDRAIDEIRDRFGSSAVSRTSLLGRSPDALVPMLPEPTEARSRPRGQEA